MRTTVEQVDLSQPVARPGRLADEFAMHRVQRSWIAVVLGSGAVTAVLLAMTGVIGLVSYYTTARLPELALRVALGAPLHRVVWLVTCGTLRSVAIGLACGALTLAFVQEAPQRFIFGTSTFAPLTLALIAAAVLLVALVALVRVPAPAAAALASGAAADQVGRAASRGGDQRGRARAARAPRVR